MGSISDYINQVAPKSMYDFNSGYSPSTVDGLVNNNYNPVYKNPVDIFTKNSSGYFNGLSPINKTMNNATYNFDSGNYESPFGKLNFGDDNDDSLFSKMNDFYTKNANMLNFGMKGVLGLGNLANALGQYNLAKKQFKFQRDFAERNLANQTKTYNTELEHQARLRSAQASSDGRANESSVEEYVRKNKL